MHPDKQLASLLGLTDAGTTLTNAYLQVDTSAGPGAGIVAGTIQFHGTADRYTVSGATAVATLYSNATTATSNPAVTLRSVGSNGGQAAAFTYDLARSVVYTRQGNPAWAGQERDSVVGIRPDDMFFGGAQTDWVDTNKIAIRRPTAAAAVAQPDHADGARQAAAAALLVLAAWREGGGRDERRRPLAVTGAGRRRRQLQPLQAAPYRAGCVVANWECVRATSYIYPNSAITNAQAAGYLTDGFETALHPLIASCPTTRSRNPRSRRSSTASSLRGRRSTSASPTRSRAATIASSGPTGRRMRRCSSRAGSGWTRTTTTSPGAGSARGTGS